MYLGFASMIFTFDSFDSFESTHIKIGGTSVLNRRALKRDEKQEGLS